jgi:trk system potassium uptake protein
MKIIIIGCGRLGSELAQRLSGLGHELVIIDTVAASFRNLPDNFRGRTVEGDALAQDVLFRAGINQADALAAVTNSDVLNAVIAHIAQEVYKIKVVVVRNYDPSNRLMYDAFNAQVVSSTSWGAQRLEEMICQPNIRTIYSAGNGEIEIFEVTIPHFWANRTVQELIQASECIPISLTRSGRATLPLNEDRLAEGDILHLSASVLGIRVVRSRLVSQKEA